MHNNDILTENYSKKIDAILNTITDARPSLEYVDSAYQRARELHKNGLREDDIAFYDPENNLIVLQKKITQDKKNQILTGIDYVISFNNVAPSMASPSAQVLNTDEKFVLHTVHHEIGHSTGIKVESDADMYAFEKMGINVALRVRI